MTEYNIKLVWDSEAFVWMATSDDVPGLVLESGSCDALIERVRHAVPEMLSLNGIPYKNNIFIHFIADRHDKAYA